MHRIRTELYETRLDVYLRDRAVNGGYYRLAVGDYLVRRCHHDDICACKARGDRRLDLSGRVLRREGRVEEVGELLRGGVVQAEGTRGYGNRLHVLHDAVDVVVRLEAESARAEDRSETLQPRNVSERDGDASLEIRRVVGYYIGTRRFPELA